MIDFISSTRVVFLSSVMPIAQVAQWTTAADSSVFFVCSNICVYTNRVTLVADAFPFRRPGRLEGEGGGIDNAISPYRTKKSREP